jgi:hypothetical protein
MHLSICLLDLYFQFTFWNLKKNILTPFWLLRLVDTRGTNAVFLFTWFVLKEKEIEDTIGVIRIRKSKDRQHNGRRKNSKSTNNDLENSIRKTKDRVTQLKVIFIYNMLHIWQHHKKETHLFY